MANEYLNPPTLFPSIQHGFSQVVVADGRRTAYISGQTAWDPDKRLVGGTSLLEQARHALRNVQTAVETAGGGINDVVSLRIYIVGYGADCAEAISTALKEAFPPGHLPATTWIGVAALAAAEFLIEIEATAVID